MDVHFSPIAYLQDSTRIKLENELCTYQDKVRFLFGTNLLVIELIQQKGKQLILFFRHIFKELERGLETKKQKSRLYRNLLKIFITG